jgi:SAM-dependent methyltransferase
MAGLNRKPFQGVLNIILFNRHFFLISAGVLIFLLLFFRYFLVEYQSFIYPLIFISFLPIPISLLVSFYVYDLSNLYEIDWLKGINFKKGEIIANINAGFDETTEILKAKIPEAQFFVYDFYNPQKHTEVSIKRARKAYPPYPGTKSLETLNFNLENNYFDRVFLFLSTHEIRDDRERTVFLTEIKRVLKNSGKIFVTEHLRDIPNLLAYNIGAFHFHPGKAWLINFQEAGLVVIKEIKTTPFITTFILQKNGNTP